MAKRYYISRIIGEGTHQNAYTSELREYIVANWPNEPKFIKQVIAPTVLMWCVMKYDLSDNAHIDVMANVSSIFSFGTQALDTTVGDLSTAKRTAIRDKLENIGFDFTWAIGATTVREILKYLNRSIQIAEWADISISTLSRFDFNTTVAKIPVNTRNKIAEALTSLNVPIDWITGTTTIREIANKVQRNDDASKRLFGTVRRAQWLFQDEDEF